MLHQRYKDGIQWHDVPCFFRAPIICEVSCPFFSHMVHKYSFFSMLSHGAHCLKVFFVFLFLCTFFIFLCVLSCRTLMSRWPIFCNFDFCIFVLFSSFFLTFTSFVLQDSDVQMARVKRERGVDVRSPVSWACYPSHRFLFLSSLCFFISWVDLASFGPFYFSKPLKICSHPENGIKYALSSGPRGCVWSFVGRQNFLLSSHNFETIPLATLANLFY